MQNQRKVIEWHAFAVVLALFAGSGGRAEEAETRPSRECACSGDAKAQLATLEERIAKAIEKIRPATVRVTLSEDEEVGVSGVIVTREGHVASCEHHRWLPGQAVTVRLPGGRKVPGETLGSYRYLDIGLFKIRERGPWPHVEFGTSTSLKPGDLCLASGYPAIDAPFRWKSSDPPRAHRAPRSDSSVASLRAYPGRLYSYSGFREVCLNTADGACPITQGGSLLLCGEPSRKHLSASPQV